MHHEMEKAQMDALLVLPRINRAVCTGCGDCVDVCHASVLTIREHIAVTVNPDDCDYCTDCEAVCPLGAITCPFEVAVAG